MTISSDTETEVGIPVPNKNFLTVKEISDITGVSKQTIYKHIKAGRLPAVRFGPRLLLIPRSILREYMGYEYV